MLIKFVFTCLLSNCVLINLFAQSEWMNLDEFVANEEKLVYWQEHWEELNELAENPININMATKEQLEQLPFLSDRMIENILYALYKYRPIVTLNSLWIVEGMDYRTLDLLKRFIYIGEYENERDKLYLRSILKYNKQELLTRVDIPLNVKSGYADYPSDILEKSPNKKYYGDPFYHNVRYRFRYREQLFFGLTAEKDAGEPFFRLYNRKGYDFYSIFFFLKNVRRIKSLAIGHYKVSFGYGLVMNTGFSFGSASTFYDVHRYGTGINKYTSVGESNYLQGMGITYQLKKRWNLSAWYSFRRQDADADSLLINSLKTDGYHRLKKDLKKKNTITNHLAGINLSYDGKYVEYGFTAVYNVFNKVLSPDYRPYNRYYPRGRDFFNAGVYYKFFRYPWIFSGETAVDKRGAVATLNTLSYSPSVHTTWTLINRYYDKRYQALYANAFGENSRVQNEAGVRIGLETDKIRRIKIFCYGDFFYFPYRKYQVDREKTSGIAGCFQLSYSPKETWNMMIKYTYKNKAKNYTTSTGRYVLPEIRQRLHYQFSYKPDELNLLKAEADYVRSSRWKQSTSDGFALGGTLKGGWKKFPLQVILSGIWFHTEDFSSRIYMYEPGLLYAFSMPAFYGKGTRAAVNLRYAFKERLVFQAKWGWTHYTDRDKMGTGAEEIQGNNRYDLQFQAKVKW